MKHTPHELEEEGDSARPLSPRSQRAQGLPPAWGCTGGCSCLQEKHPQGLSTKTDLPNLASVGGSMCWIQSQVRTDPKPEEG